MKASILQIIKRNGYRAQRFAAFLVHVVMSLLSLRKPVIKQRYLKTRSGKWRARYIAASIVSICFMTFLLAVSGANTSTIFVKPSSLDLAQYNEITTLNHVDPSAATLHGHDAAMLNPSQMGDINDLRQSILSAAPVPPKEVLPKEWHKAVEMQKGGTLSGLLEKNDVGAGDAYKAIQVMGKALDPRDLKPGQKITIHYERLDTGETAFTGMDVIKSGIETILIRRAEGYGFKTETQTKDVISETRAARAHITRSIYADLASQDVPDGIINQFIKAYSWSIDFQRDIRGGEEIEVLYTVNKTKDESYLRSDELLYANMIIKGKQRPIYIFSKKDGDRDYYNDKGESVRKALLKTPVDGARVSSGFGKRKHPVLGYTKMHKGIDFAAPTGTPVYAAGKGVVERANWFSSFGNYIRVRHNGKYKTAYAHLHRIAKGVHAGARVKQGQVIGYVGTTGRSTGAHLHYEIHVNGKAVNPRSVDLPIGETLTGTNFANFKNSKMALDKKYQKYLAATGAPTLIKASTMPAAVSDDANGKTVNAITPASGQTDNKASGVTITNAPTASAPAAVKDDTPTTPVDAATMSKPTAR